MLVDLAQVFYFVTLFVTCLISESCVQQLLVSVAEQMQKFYYLCFRFISLLIWWLQVVVIFPLQNLSRLRGLNCDFLWMLVSVQREVQSCNVTFHICMKIQAAMTERRSMLNERKRLKYNEKVLERKQVNDKSPVMLRRSVIAGQHPKKITI